MGWSEQTVTYGFNENGGWATYNGNPLAKASIYGVKRDGTHVGTESGMGAETSDTQGVQLITEYTYDEVDDHGNWTKRSYKRSDGATGTDTRVITYY